MNNNMKLYVYTGHVMHCSTWYILMLLLPCTGLIIRSKHNNINETTVHRPRSGGGVRVYPHLYEPR